MRKLVGLALFVFCVQLGCAAPQMAARIAKQASSPANDAAVSKLQSNMSPAAIRLSFVQTSSLAHIAPIDGASNTYQLTMSNISPYITYITQRPGSVTGLAVMKNFLVAWKVGLNSFEKHPPNAVIYSATLNNEPNDSGKYYAVKLSNPQYDMKNGEMSYDVAPLSGQQFLLKQLELRDMILVVN